MNQAKMKPSVYERGILTYSTFNYIYKIMRAFTPCSKWPFRSCQPELSTKLSLSRLKPLPKFFLNLRSHPKRTSERGLANADTRVNFACKRANFADVGEGVKNCKILRTSFMDGP